MHTIENNQLRVTVKETGAELCRIQSVITGMDYLWDGNPDIWPSHAPVLFPIIGELKEGTYHYQGNNYQLNRHGFVRNNPKVRLADSTDNSLRFTLSYDEDLLLAYPFRFEFNIRYTLEDNRIIVHHEVKNLGDDVMLFSIGGHPAFRCPRQNGENYDDFYLEFEQRETVSRWLLTDKGLLSGETEPVLKDTKNLPIYHRLFDQDALVFKDLKSTKVSLKSRKSDQVVALYFGDFPYLGIWAKPKGDYVCIEPWHGVADSHDTDQNLETKEGIIRLQGGGTFTASYTIEIIE
ncbi:aldose 1-epimerase family protein [Telluribacter sp. SYSU D00476]|uniref:aldose 1-epimerase family protein n=1 Tax=Telluribacter sp. SYSU D00476 TaxID=2811430 RepID=UPI001FF25648|nr:aldose 1-epimerase family protein [Telluribacter sp. SYSU D00476]